jgi:hypothetical protein
MRGDVGDDTLLGGPGKDTITASPISAGEDKIYGGPGSDYLYDAGGRNTIKGGPGDDEVDGHGRLLGGTGDDRINGETGSVGGPRGILGGAGEDHVYSQDDANDAIYVSDGNATWCKAAGTARIRSTSTTASTKSIRAAARPWFPGRQPQYCQRINRYDLIPPP